MKTPSQRLADKEKHIGKSYELSFHLSEYISEANKLATELEAAQKEIETMKHTAQCAYCGQIVDRTGGSLADHALNCENHPLHEAIQLRTQVAELTKDKERLDWYQKYRNGEWNFTLGQSQEFYNNLKRDGLRTAIDTAIAAQKEGK